MKASELQDVLMTICNARHDLVLVARKDENNESLNDVMHNLRHAAIHIRDYLEERGFGEFHTPGLSKDGEL